MPRVLPLLLLVTLNACAFADPGAPRSVVVGRAATDGEPGTCPRIAGTYHATDNPLGRVIGRSRAYEHRESPWQYLRVQQRGDSVLQLEYLAEGHADTTTLRQPGGFSCRTGWVQTVDMGGGPDPMEHEINDPRSVRREFRFAVDKSGALVGQLIVRRFREVTVWCGDGCKGFPIPWTGRREVSYSRLTDSLSAPETAALEAPESSAPERERLRSQDMEQRIAREIAAREQGEPSGDDELLARVTSALRRTEQILAVTPSGDSARLTVELAASEDLAPLIERLQHTPGIRDARVAPLYRARTAEGRWQLSVWVWR